jgi:hypothetical protein
MKTIKPAATQRDVNMDFDGMESIAPKHSTKFMGNQHSGMQNPNKTFNMGRGPTTGNKGDLAGRSCTPPASAVPGLPAQGSVRDNINRGAQVRTPGGTRDFAPSAGQNYHGNADKINMGRGPTKGNQC